jgi:hypothetical protein
LPREETVRAWLETMLPAAISPGPRGGLHLMLDLRPMTDTGTGEPSLIVNGRPLRPFDIEPLLGRIGVEACGLLAAERN